MIMVYISK